MLEMREAQHNIQSIPERAMNLGGRAKNANNKLQKWGRRHTGGHDLQRIVDTHGKVLW